MVLSLLALLAHGQDLNITADILANASTGDFAPSLIGSLNHGKSYEKNSALFDLSLIQTVDTAQRFSAGVGVEFLTGYSHKAKYDLYSHSGHNEVDAIVPVFTQRKAGPSGIWLQQLFADFKYRSLFLTLGLKEHTSALLCQELSSGDLVESGNSRPIPEIRIGFIDFQPIPMTKKWVWIQGELSLSKMTDNGWLKHQYNYYNYHITLGERYTYQRCYFRTNPSQPFSVTFGMQSAGIFGGTTYYYSKGELTKIDKHKSGLKTMFKMLIPTGENGEDFYEGSSLGSWDFFFRYRLRNGATVRAYLQKLWEDGSGIGFRNKWDGIWGLEFRQSGNHLISAVVAEYIDFRDQSGPIHWDPADSPGTTVTSQTTGRDNYYNNTYYNSYANYGMSIGTPFLISPVYNRDGYPAFACNRVNGCHLGIMGNLTQSLNYRVLFTHERGLGTYNNPYYHPRYNTGALAELSWQSAFLHTRAQIAFDAGKLRGNNFGFLLALGFCI